MAAGPETRQTREQQGVLPVQEVSQDVQLGFPVPGADLDAGNDFDAQTSAGLDGLRNPVYDVVVGDREGAHACLPGQEQHLSRREAAVRVGGVEVEVDAGHGTAMSDE